MHIQRNTKTYYFSKNTNDNAQLDNIGIAGATTNKQTHCMVSKQSTRQNYFTDGPRNLVAAEHWTNDGVDYGKKSFYFKIRKRGVTGLRTHVSNVQSVVKSVVAPLMDVMKTTKKENVGNPNQSGYFKANVSKMQVYDQADIAKTTIKETLIHDERTGNYQRNVALKPTVYDPVVLLEQQ